jgi:HPt (histidine-containing phosphotransfer) domain-containing protein
LCDDVIFFPGTGLAAAMQRNKDETGDMLARHPITPDDEVERELLLRYLVRKRSDIESLGRALADEDYALICRIGHNLAGSGAAYGFVRISSLGQRIEAASGKSSSSEVAHWVAELQRFLDTVTIEEPR